MSAGRPDVPHLVLVGLPGAGKTTVGRLVAERLGRPFLDFDAELERREGATVARLFAERGERHFRALEEALTVELAAAGGMVLAPGGGWITNPRLVALLRPPARIIHLAVTPPSALRRMGPRVAARPLLAAGDPLVELAALLDRREAAYRVADHVVDTEVLDLQQVVDAVAALAWLSGGR